MQLVILSSHSSDKVTSFGEVAIDRMIKRNHLRGIQDRAVRHLSLTHQIATQMLPRFTTINFIPAKGTYFKYIWLTLHYSTQYAYDSILMFEREENERIHTTGFAYYF